MEEINEGLKELDDITVPSRIIKLPLSWDDPQTRLAAERYQKTVRPDAPWCPSNPEFIRRINGLDSIEDVKKIVFDAEYLVLGLGDVYLGAPVATPVDPRHRMVTTKYNPARPWTRKMPWASAALTCAFTVWRAPEGISLWEEPSRCGIP